VIFLNGSGNPIVLQNCHITEFFFDFDFPKSPHENKDGRIVLSSMQYLLKKAVKKMFVNGIYSESERKMMDAWREDAEQDVGWISDKPGPRNDHPVNFRTATKEIIRHMALAHDYKNPLYRDEDYARQSKYGKIVAPPFLLNCIANGHAHFMGVPEDVGQFVGCHLGEDFVWHRTIKEGDSFKVFQGMPQMRDMTPPGEQPERVMGSFDPCYIYDQNDELIAEWWHILVTVYIENGRPRDNILRIGYELDPSALELAEGIHWTKRPKYTREEADLIQRLYEEEPRRGGNILYWEDVKIGEALPPAFMGPITYWDCVTYMATHVFPPINMMEGRRLTPQMVIRDPETNISYRDFEWHFCEETPKLVGWYSHTVVEQLINSFMGRCVSNWMGDDGEFRSYRWRKFANTTIGDTVIARGRVIRKYITEDGECRADIDCVMENIKGFLANMGPTAIALPSRAKLAEGKTSALDPSEQALDLNPQGIVRGDHFRVKPRDEWELPGGYPLTGKTGVVYELPMDVPGFVYAIMDESCTGIEPRAVVGFRMTDLEKL
jgi:hypothetical protein